MKVDIRSILRDERGNMTVFVLSIFTFMLLVLFTALYNFSSVFVGKEQAMNSAQVASQSGVKSVYDAMEMAIQAYDVWAIANRKPPLSPKVSQRESSLRASNPEWAASEVRYTAIDQVLADHLGSNPDLMGFVTIGLAEARLEIPGVVTYILHENDASLKNLDVFNGDDRIEVTAAVDYESDNMGFEFLSTYRDEIVQTGESRKIGFLVAVPGW
ncbi:MAG TPA: pilus assembly protein TadG-related protein [Candidatus Bathyarchaeia archaeon]|nr:pilus assembly protein TadG-related protein [Candidatus Bathyarchaeia archaeon]